ncbi:MAG: hypothetical protein ACI93R_003199 [Flavobacteriales bacterium]
MSGEREELRLNIATLIASGNSFEAGIADLGAIIISLVFEANGLIDFYVKNIRIE